MSALSTAPPHPHPTLHPSGLRIRELPSTEWDRFREHPPFNVLGLPDPKRSRVLVGEDHVGKIRAYWFLFSAVHVEPFWIDEEYRKRPSLIRQLWTRVRNILMETENKVAFAIIEDGASLEQNSSYVERLGFFHVPGRLYMLSTEEGLDMRGQGPKAPQKEEVPNG